MRVIEKILELMKSNSIFAVATIVETDGSVPGKKGFKMVVQPDGTTTGTVGGGAIEKKVMEKALKKIPKGESGTEEYILSDKAEPGPNVVPMKCSGKMTVYYEVYGRKPSVYIFGGGHVGNALMYFLKPLGYHVVLIDNREEFASSVKNPDASEWFCYDYEKYAGEFNPPADSFAVILTHGHKYDYDILRTLYERKIGMKYIGVISSASKAESMKEQLKKDVENPDLSRLHSPIGLKIGGDSAHEIALSITAEIQKTRYGK